MPSKSESQRSLMGMALAIKRGEMKASESPEAAKLAEGMTEQQLEDFASKVSKAAKKGRLLWAMKPDANKPFKTLAQQERERREKTYLKKPYAEPKSKEEALRRQKDAAQFITDTLRVHKSESLDALSDFVAKAEQGGLVPPRPGND